MDVIDAYVAEFEGEARRLGEGQWGLTVPPEAASEEPLHVGLHLTGGLLRAQAPAAWAGHRIDPWMLLWWNRQTRHVRFACTRSREIWVHADLPATAVEERALDRLLGLVVEAAVAVRQLARAG